MTTALLSFFSKLFNPVWLTGPLLDKELRVSSRRRRNYFLRFIYIALLSIFILSTWYSTLAIRSSGSTVYQISRLSQAGKNIITGIVWFQFVVAQIVAIVMLSSSVSDEIRSGTLSVLMTTPINSFQIVTGKLLSKLLQLTLLLAISLPLLAIIRVFGGVPWDYIVASVCITLTAAVLAGALSLLLSMSYRYAHTVILVAIMAYLVVFGVLPGLFNLLAVKGIFIFDRQVTQSIIALTNPFWAFAATNAMLLIQSGVPKFFSWPVHCLIMLAVTAVLITISVCRVRKAALCEAFGQSGKLWSGRALRRKGSGNIDNTGSQSPAGSSMESLRTIKPVTGQPIVWKEMRKGFVGRGKGDIAISVLLIGTFIITFVLLLFSSKRNIILPHYFVSGFYLVVMIRLAVLSAGSIAAEKEARTWPVLLATPLEDKEIVRGKAIAAFRRNIPLLLLYFVLLCAMYIRLYSLGSLAGSDGLLQILVLLALVASGFMCSVLFVIGSGSYFGVRLKTTTAAVAATVGLYLVMTYLLCGMFNPLRILLYRMALRRAGPWSYYAMTITFMLIQAGIGLSLAQRAVRRLRRDIF